MTPEEVETRLEALRMPLPPERLRERCLGGSPRRRRRPGWAIAASFLMFAVVVGFIVTSRDETSDLIERLAHPIPAERDRAALRLIELGDAARPQLGRARSHRDAEIAFRANELWDNPERSRQLIQATDDPVLRRKLEALLKKNPGESVLVVRVNELRDGRIRPVTKGFGMAMLVEDATREPDPLEDPAEVHADVDSDGTLLYVIPPGPYRAVGHSINPKALSFVWEYKHFVAKAGEVLLLEDALFAPWVEWTAPAAGAAVSMKEDPKISWKPYPEIRRVKIDVDRKVKYPDGAVSWITLGSLTCESPKDSAVPLSQLRKAMATPFVPGELIEVNLAGYDEKGRLITSPKEKLEILLKE